MASTFQAPDWLALQSAAPPGRSANPVLKLVFDGLIVWLKVAKGGARVAFAGTVMQRAGFAGSGTRILPEGERNLAFQVLGAAAEASPALRSTLTRMDQELGDGGDAILLENVVGDGDYRNYIDTQGGGLLDIKAGWATHAAVMDMSRTQRDLARMMAADMILGNYDRVASNTKNGTHQFNAANFVYNATTGNFLPIDNDTVAPSREHLRKQNGQPVTQEQLYRTAISGGILADPDGIFPQAEQGSLDAMLGPEAHDHLETCLKYFYSSGISSQDEVIFKSAAAKIAPMVKEELSALLLEMKSPTGGREGLFRTMKAYQGVQGMNYSVFKVKCRFADLVVNNGTSTADAAGTAMQYGLYRDWKALLDEVSSRELPAYQLPLVTLQSLSFSQKVKRTVNTTAMYTGLLDKSELAVKAAADAAKRSVRGRDNVATIRASYEQLRTVPDTDNRIIKAKVLLTSSLISAELDELEQFFQQVHAAQSSDPIVARLYAKALRKLELRFHRLWAAFGTLIQQLERHSAALSKQDSQLLGSAVLARKLSNCKQAMTLVRHAQW
ncbi:MAG: hypothetical protein EON54_01405 [Alcaligenaceae bacterium]|nr:MAG: hypothetical protein EON54_01405 [Alcaligenaceae bacterium]